MKTIVGGLFVDGAKFLRGNAHFVAANAKGHDRFGLAALGCAYDVHGRVGAELPRRVENPVYAKPLFLERFGGMQEGLEIGFGLLFAEQHHSNRKSDLGIDHALRQKVLAQVSRD